MASKIENTLGTRIQNATDMVGVVQSFAGFSPVKAEDAPTEVNKVITALKTADQAEAAALQSYKVSVAGRANLIGNDKDSLRKLVSPIRAYLTAILGKENVQFASLNKILNQIAGYKPGREKKNPDAKSVSTSQQSAASLAQAFSDLIATLATLTPSYAPVNAAITLPNLRLKLAAIEQANRQVTLNFNALTTARERRNASAEDLKNRLMRVKKTVLAQYGNASAEYAKVKSFKV